MIFWNVINLYPNLHPFSFHQNRPLIHLPSLKWNYKLEEGRNRFSCIKVKQYNYLFSCWRDSHKCREDPDFKIKFSSNVFCNIKFNRKWSDIKPPKDENNEGNAKRWFTGSERRRDTFSRRNSSFQKKPKNGTTVRIPRPRRPEQTGNEYLNCS